MVPLAGYKYREVLRDAGNRHQPLRPLPGWTLGALIDLGMVVPQNPASVAGCTSVWRLGILPFGTGEAARMVRVPPAGPGSGFPVAKD